MEPVNSTDIEVDELNEQTERERRLLVGGAVAVVVILVLGFIVLIAKGGDNDDVTADKDNSPDPTVSAQVEDGIVAAYTNSWTVWLASVADPASRDQVDDTFTGDALDVHTDLLDKLAAEKNTITGTYKANPVVQSVDDNVAVVTDCGLETLAQNGPDGKAIEQSEDQKVGYQVTMHRDGDVWKRAVVEVSQTACSNV